ncbi:MAG: hypothetical protein MUF61_02825 [archaeon]|jgi:tRNA G10  N-methylase Trm11|nr:hypothetical protein [archaeon]
MKYLFILGRNPLVSEAEILSYVERTLARRVAHKIRLNALLLETDNELNIKKMMNELGGTIAIGKVLFSGKKKDVLEGIKKKPIYFGRENKVVYSVMSYAENGDEFSEILDAMKENFSGERLKARYKGVSGTVKLQSGRIVHGSPEKIMLRDMNYFVFSCSGEMNFGYLETSYDSEEAERKDMEKPYRRESLAISPRLARILINLSQVKDKETLADPFCGIGVILAEAMLRDISVIGIDIDKEAAKDARENIDWLRRNYKISANHAVINSDSRAIKLRERIAGIATEPSLGELLKKIPSPERAQEMLAKFEDLMIDVINNLKKGLETKGKIAFTAPLIKTQRGRISCDFGRICEKTGMRIYKLSGLDSAFPIREFREDQIVGRDIMVLSF